MKPLDNDTDNHQAYVQVQQIALAGLVTPDELRRLANRIEQAPPMKRLLWLIDAELGDELQQRGHGRKQGGAA